MDCTPDLSVPHHLPKFVQVHVHCISDAIQPPHPQMPSSTALNLSQHQGLPMSQLFTSDDQNTEVSASASVLLTSFQGWFPLRLTGLISLLSKGLSEVFSSTRVWRHQRFTFFTAQLSQPYMITGKTIALTIMDLCKQSNVSAFQHTVWVCHSFPAKKQMSSDLMAAVTTASDFRAQEEEIYHYFHLFPLICQEVMGPNAMILAFLIFNFKPAFLLYPHQDALQFLFTFCH